MTTKDFVQGWLKGHLRPDAEPVKRKDQEHFERILEDICEAYGKALTDKACEWLDNCLPNIEYITNASVYRQDKSKFIDSFKKAMEE